MVRETEREHGATVLLRADLPAGEPAGERRAEAVLATVDALLRRGTPVVLITREPAGVPRRHPAGGAVHEVSRPVVDRRDAGRRLARAVAG